MFLYSVSPYEGTLVEAVYCASRAEARTIARDHAKEGYTCSVYHVTVPVRKHPARSLILACLNHEGFASQQVLLDTYTPYYQHLPDGESRCLVKHTCHVQHARQAVAGD